MTSKIFVFLFGGTEHRARNAAGIPGVLEEQIVMGKSPMDEPLCLIVDDEPAIRTCLSAILRHKGIQSLEAENAVEALRILQKRGGEIDLLITDIQMPGDMDGVDLAYSVKNLCSFLPVILISGNVERAPTGFTFVPKPFRADESFSAIDKAMTGIRARSAR